MQNHISSVSIKGLWGLESEIKFQLNRKYNFLIGRNGSGKTTVINLIAAVLLADFERLDRTPFSEVTINLHPFSGRKRPSIIVRKIQKPNLPYFDITYKIKLSSTEETEFDLDAYAEERAYRGIPQRMLRERIFRERYLFIQRQLEELVNVTWLSVHRTPDEKERPDEKKTGSAVDQKLIALNIEIVKYFSKLAKVFADKTIDFQKNSFLSLTKVQKSADITNFAKKIDLDAESAALKSIFELLGVSKSAYEPQLIENSFRFSSARTKFLDKGGLTFDDLFVIVNSFRAHSLVSLYETLQTQSRDIFKPRDAFFRVLNSLLAPKKIAHLSATNELVITTQSRQIPLDELSSGEKQLIIILGQALLQENNPSVYIADEPELSLHVEWQEKITDSIEQLNPNAQIIFATHSPDIVGNKSDKILNMEKILP